MSGCLQHGPVLQVLGFTATRALLFFPSCEIVEMFLEAGHDSMKTSDKPSSLSVVKWFVGNKLFRLFASHFYHLIQLIATRLAPMNNLQNDSYNHESGHDNGNIDDNDRREHSKVILWRTRRSCNSQYDWKSEENNKYCRDYSTVKLIQSACRKRTVTGAVVDALWKMYWMVVGCKWDTLHFDIF